MERSSIASYSVLVASITVTLVIWGGFHTLVEDSLLEDFHNDSDYIIEKTKDRLEKYNDVLVGIKGLYTASDLVTLDEWGNFLLSQELEDKYPGIQGIGFVQNVHNQSDYDELISQMKDYGVIDYNIKPEGIRSQYFPVTFLYPDDIRNRQAVGYDIYSESIRANAVDTAIKTKSMTITGKIILVQEIDENIQNGFLMLLPIFDDEKLLGLAYAVFRVNDLMEGIIENNVLSHTNVKFYDGEAISENLFFDSENIVSVSNLDMNFMHYYTLEFGNRDWNFILESPHPELDSGDAILYWLIPLVGFSMSILVFLIMYNFNKHAISLQIQKEKNVFDAMISHELKTPLVPIRGYCDMLMVPDMLGNLNSAQKRAVEKIILNSNHLLSLVQKILTAQKLDLQEYHFKYEKITIDSLMNEMHDSHKHLMTAKNITFENNSLLDDILSTDKNQLREVFTNLIQNAVDFTPENGMISLSAKKQNNFIVFSVFNNGPSIPKKLHDNLFQKFYQVDTSITRKHGGSGLGLAICRGIIDAFGGKIWVESDEGKGVTFYFKVPINEVPKN
jgi:signal transduction histidine kinase